VFVHDENKYYFWQDYRKELVKIPLYRLFTVLFELSIRRSSAKQIICRL